MPTTQTIPAQNRAPGTYGPFGPFDLGADNSVEVQFNSTDWLTPGGTFELHCDRLPSGAAAWILDDFKGGWATATVNEKSGLPNVPYVRYDCLPGDQVRVSFVVAGRTINLGAAITRDTKSTAAAPKP
jgi:hypothetical protein